MKRIGFFAVLMILCTGFVFAENAGARSVHVIGADIPIVGQTLGTSQKVSGVKYNEYDKFSGYGVTFMYHRLKVSEGHFSSFINCELGYLNISNKEIELEANGKTSTTKVDNPKGYDCIQERFSFGLGGAPVNTDRFIFAIHGTFGVNSDIGFLKQTASETVSGVTTTTEIDAWMIGLWATLGVNADFAVRLGDHVGVFAGVNMYTNLIGFGVCGNEIRVKTGSSSSTTSNADGMAIMPGRFNIDLRAGVAFVF